MNGFEQVKNYPGNQEVETDALMAFLTQAGLDYNEVTKLNEKGGIVYDFVRRLVVFPGSNGYLPIGDRQALLLRVPLNRDRGSYALLGHIDQDRERELRQGELTTKVTKVPIRELPNVGNQIEHLYEFFQTYTASGLGWRTEQFELRRLSKELALRANTAVRHKEIEISRIYLEPVSAVERDGTTDYSTTEHGGYSWRIRKIQQ